MIVVKVRDRDIKAAPMGPVTTGSVGLPVRWYFDEAWDELTKIAVFRVNDTYGPDMAILEDVCIVPNQLLDQDNAGENLFIGVYGRDVYGEIAVPTIWTHIRIEDGTIPQTVDPAEPTPEWPQQVQTAADEALRVAHALRNDAEHGAFDGATFIPTVNEEGVISWRNDKGYDNPEPRSIRGPQGLQGVRGEKGETGESGITTPVNAFFTLSVDGEGNLYANYADGGSAPEFEYDSVSGNLYFVTEDE